MVNISTSHPLGLAARRRVWRIVQNLSETAAFGLTAQREAELRAEDKEAKSKEQQSVALAHSLPKLVFNPLMFFAFRVTRACEAMCYHTRRQIMDIEGMDLHRCLFDCRGKISRIPDMDKLCRSLHENIGRYDKTQRAPTHPFAELDSTLKELKQLAGSVQPFFIRRGSAIVQAFGSLDPNIEERNFQGAVNSCDLTSSILLPLQEIFEAMELYHASGHIDSHSRCLVVQNGNNNKDARSVLASLLKLKIDVDGSKISKNSKSIKVLGDQITYLLHFYNLVDNAVSAFDLLVLEKPVKFGSLEEKTVHPLIKVITGTDYITVEVSDRGKGIVDEDIQGLLETVLEGAGSQKNGWQMDDTGSCKDALDELRARLTGEGTGKGLYYFARYLRFVWGPYDRPEPVIKFLNWVNPTKIECRLPIELG
jgi:hypothetical protein